LFYSSDVCTGGSIDGEDSVPNSCVAYDTSFDDNNIDGEGSLDQFIIRTCLENGPDASGGGDAAVIIMYVYIYFFLIYYLLINIY
jgi:hypothetical protein